MSRDVFRLFSALTLSLVVYGALSSTTAAEEKGSPASIGGKWAVQGETVEIDHEENKRSISGTIVLHQDNDRFTSTFTMKTMFPTPGGSSLQTHVIGKGEGTIEGKTIRGEARTQLVISNVPGVDPDFAFVPRTTTTRIASTVEGRVQHDGTIVLLIESKGEPGQAYRPTRTTLRGKRIQSTSPKRRPE